MAVMILLLILEIIKFLRWAFSLDKNQLICFLFDQNRYFYYLNFSKSHTSYTFCAWEFWFFLFQKMCFVDKNKLIFVPFEQKKICLNVQKNSKSQTPAVQTPAVQGNFKFFSQKCVSSIFVIFEQNNFFFWFSKIF